MNCNKCGAKVDGQSKFCGKCGSPLPEDDGVRKLIDAMEEKKKRKHRNTIVGVSFTAVLLLAVIFIFNACFGYRAVVKKFMNAYEEGDGEAMYSMASGYTKEFACAYYTEYLGGSNLTDYLGTDFTKEDVLDYIEIFYSEDFKTKSENFFDDFDRELGSSYKLSYEIVETEDVDAETMSYMNQDIHQITGNVSFSSIKMVKIEVTGEAKGNTYSDTMTLYLSREPLIWKVMFAEKLF